MGGPSVCRSPGPGGFQKPGPSSVRVTRLPGTGSSGPRAQRLSAAGCELQRDVTAWVSSLQSIKPPARVLPPPVFFIAVNACGGPDRLIELVEFDVHNRSLTPSILGELCARDVELPPIVRNEHSDAALQAVDGEDERACHGALAVSGAGIVSMMPACARTMKLPFRFA